MLDLTARAGLHVHAASAREAGTEFEKMDELIEGSSNLHDHCPTFVIGVTLASSVRGGLEVKCKMPDGSSMLKMSSSSSPKRHKKAT